MIWGKVLKHLICTVIAVAALAGCAQLPPELNQLGNRLLGTNQQATAPVIDFVVPADALAARDPQLTGVLGKAGALAAKQPKATTIVVSANAQDFAYMNQAIRAGIPAQRVAAVTFENVTAAPGRASSVQIKAAQ